MLLITPIRCVGYIDLTSLLNPIGDELQRLTARNTLTTCFILSVMVDPFVISSPLGLSVNLLPDGMPFK